jgi:putative transposase
LADTLDAIVVERPQPTEQAPQHLCLDKAYDNRTGQNVCAQRDYHAHIRRIGEEKKDEAGQKTYPARRWVVERTFSWLSRCRALLVRYDKKAECYLAMFKLACALLWYRRLHDLRLLK